MIYKFFDKSFGVLVLTQGLELFVRINNQPGNYTSPSLENFRRKVYSSYRDNVWVDDLADMLVIIKNIKGVRLLLCVPDIYRKYAWVVPLKDKKSCYNH